MGAREGGFDQRRRTQGKLLPYTVQDGKGDSCLYRGQTTVNRSLEHAELSKGTGEIRCGRYS